jgi:hypothetical protein
MAQDLTVIDTGLPVQNDVMTINATVNAQMTEARADFNTVRENLLNLIEDAKEGVKNVGSMAQASQAWQYYNVLNAMIKTAVDANYRLLEAHKTRKDIGEPPGPKVVKNQLIMTSTAMLELIKKEDGEA